MSQTELEAMETELSEMGPIDYIVLAWPGGVPTGAGVAPLLVDLVDRGIIRILDVAFAAKDEDGNVTALDLEHLGPDSPFAAFEGASSGLLDFEDIETAGESEAGNGETICLPARRAAELRKSLAKQRRCDHCFARVKTTGFDPYDTEIERVIRGTWRYRPFLVEGKPEPVCTAVTFIYSQNAPTPPPPPPAP